MDFEDYVSGGGMAILVSHYPTTRAFVTVSHCRCGLFLLKPALARRSLRERRRWLVAKGCCSALA